MLSAGLLAPNQWRHHLIHLLMSWTSGPVVGQENKISIQRTFLATNNTDLPRKYSQTLNTKYFHLSELFCYSKIQTFLIRPRLEVYLVEFDRRCGKSNTLLRLKKHFYMIKNKTNLFRFRWLIFLSLSKYSLFPMIRLPAS